MINFQLLQDSIEFYKKKNFVRIETPWTVTPAISNITKPAAAQSFNLENKNKILVASAEQSFLYLYCKGFLPPGQFQSVTPCFRDEPFDSTHSKYFIKNELIKTDFTSKNNLDDVIYNAYEFFLSICDKNNKDAAALKVVETHDEKFNCKSWDILYNEIEIGSYGIRECKFLKWIYGTGCAEPRLSLTLESKIF